MDRKVSPVLFAMPVLLLLVLAPGSYGSAAIITRDGSSIWKASGLCAGCHTTQVIRLRQNVVKKDEADNAKPIPVDNMPGVTCASCHEASSGELISMKQCLQCFDIYRRLGELGRASVH